MQILGPSLDRKAAGATADAAAGSVFSTAVDSVDIAATDAERGTSSSTATADPVSACRVGRSGPPWASRLGELLLCSKASVRVRAMHRRPACAPRGILTCVVGAGQPHGGAAVPHRPCTLLCSTHRAGALLRLLLRWSHTHTQDPCVEPCTRAGVAARSGATDCIVCGWASPHGTTLAWPSRSSTTSTTRRRRYSASCEGDVRVSGHPFAHAR